MAGACFTLPWYPRRYACQGGTGEDWNMLIELDEEGVAQCFVGR